MLSLVVALYWAWAGLYVTRTWEADPKPMTRGAYLVAGLFGGLMLPCALAYAFVVCSYRALFK